jgi:hypothetical protein
VHLDVGKWTCDVRGPVRHIVPAVRAVCGRDWTLDFDHRSRSLRIPVDKTADLVAALENAKVHVVIKGAVPEVGLW